MVLPASPARPGRSVAHRTLALLVPLLAAVAIAPSPAEAGLTVLRPGGSEPVTFRGHGGYSADAKGPTDAGSLSAEIPAGSTVQRAYLYGTFENYGSTDPVLTPAQLGVSFEGAARQLTQISAQQIPGPDYFYTARADVTDVVAAKVGTGGGTTSFAASGPAPRPLHGLSLVVLYSNPASPDVSIAVMEGSSDPTGDSATLTFTTPLDTSIPDFRARLSLGIGWSDQGPRGNHVCAGSQQSFVDVNGQRLSSCAGGSDDGVNPSEYVTVGGVGDAPDNPANPFTTNSGTDDELYHLEPFLGDGDTQLVIDSRNTSRNDHIFLAIVEITADASALGDNEPPPAGPAPSARTSTGVGTATQQVTVTPPAGGSVRLLDGSTLVTSVTRPGVGTYTVDPASGVISFSPVLGYAGTAPAVSFRVTNAASQSGDNAYTATVTPPAGPVATARASSGAGVSPQVVTLPIPDGGRVRLLDAGGTPASTVTVAGQGVYELDAATGTVTFTPVLGFRGTPTAVGYRLTDAYGQSVDATYQPVVEAPSATPARGSVEAPPATPARDSVSTCFSRRSMTIHWKVRRGVRLKRTKVVVNGTPIRSLGGAVRKLTVDLEGRPKGTVTVEVVAITTKGTALRTTRTYRTCVERRKGAPLRTLQLSPKAPAAKR